MRLCTLPLAFAFACVSAGAQAAQAPQNPLTVAAPAKTTTGAEKDQPGKGKASERAETAYLAGARLFDRKDVAGAELELERAVKLAPARRDYAMALDLVRQNEIGQLLAQAAAARLAGRTTEAAQLLARAGKLDPHDARVLEHTQAEPEVHPSFTPRPQLAFAPPVHVEPLPAARAFDLRGDVRTVVTAVARDYGVQVSFDDSVAPQQLHFVLEAAPYNLSMPILLHQAHLFALPLGGHSVLVARDSQENHERFDRLVEETIFIPASTPEQLTELTQIIRNVFDVKTIAVQPSSGALILRAPEETIRAVNYTVADLVDGGAQVELQVRLYSINKSVTRNIGLQTPTSLGAFPIAAEAQKLVNANATAVSGLISSGAYVPTGNTARDTLAEALLLVVSGVATDANVSGLISIFGGGLTLFGVDQVGGAQLNLSLSSSDARALDDITVRVGDRKETVLRIGERYPVTTSTYSSGISNATTAALGNASINGVPASTLLSQLLGSSGTIATVPIIQYEDLGLTFKTTPTVLKSGLISVHLELKLESLEGAVLDNIPVLNSSAFSSDITLLDGSTAVLLSDLSSTESAAVSGLPGLGELPGFNQTIGGDRLRETAHSELVMLVTPHLVRRRSNVLATPPYIFHTSVPQEF